MKMILQRWGLAAVCMSVMVLSAEAGEHTKDSLTTVKENVDQKKALLVDVRETSEWDKGHIAGAVFLPLSELKNGINAESLQKKLPKDRIIYTHCVVGKRSLTAGDILQKHGYDVRPLKAGYTDLLQAGFKKAEK